MTKQKIKSFIKIQGIAVSFLMLIGCQHLYYFGAGTALGLLLAQSPSPKSAQQSQPAKPKATPTSENQKKSSEYPILGNNLQRFQNNDDDPKPPNTIVKNSNRDRPPRRSSPPLRSALTLDFSYAPTATPTPKPSPPTPTPTEKPHALNLSKAISLYRDFKYAECYRNLYDIINNSSPNNPKYLDALIYAGASAYMIHNDDIAEKLFKKVTQIDPEYNINKNEFPPNIVHYYNEIKYSR